MQLFRLIWKAFAENVLITCCHILRADNESFTAEVTFCLSTASSLSRDALDISPSFATLAVHRKGILCMLSFFRFNFSLRIHLHKLCLFSQPGFTSRFFQTSILHLLNKFENLNMNGSSLLRNFISSKPVLSQISLFKFSSISYVNITSRSSFFGDV